MNELNALEIVEHSQIKMQAKNGKNIVEAGREAIQLSNFLKVSIRLHFNEHQIDIFTNTKLEDIIKNV